MNPKEPNLIKQLDLKQVQQRFLDAVYQMPNAELGDIIVTDDVINESSQGIKIYQHAYRSRLQEAIDSDFPALGKLLGDDMYEQLITQYLTHHRPRSPSLNDFGKNLAHFIKTNFLPEQTIVHELSDFEWLLRSTFDSKNFAHIAHDSLTKVAPEAWPSMKFSFVGNLSIRHYAMNTPAVWQKLKDDETPDIEQLPIPQTWLIWRQNLITLFRSMEVDEACALEIARNGGDFSELCEALLEWYDEPAVPERAVSLLQGWIACDLITALN